jgi:putative membrane protein
MSKKAKDIVNDIKKSPSDMLSFGRTKMANERTLNSFISTSIGILASGVGFIKLFENPVLFAIGWILIPFSLLFLIWGIKRYRFVNKLLRDSYKALKTTLNDEDGLEVE